jgi:hypothetical protein
LRFAGAFRSHLILFPLSSAFLFLRSREKKAQDDEQAQQLQLEAEIRTIWENAVRFEERAPCFVGNAFDSSVSQPHGSCWFATAD